MDLHAETIVRFGRIHIQPDRIRSLGDCMLLTGPIIRKQTRFFCHSSKHKETVRACMFGLVLREHGTNRRKVGLYVMFLALFVQIIHRHVAPKESLDRMEYSPRHGFLSYVGGYVSTHSRLI